MKVFTHQISELEESTPSLYVLKRSYLGRKLFHGKKSLMMLHCLELMVGIVILARDLKLFSCKSHTKQKLLCIMSALDAGITGPKSLKTNNFVH